MKQIFLAMVLFNALVDGGAGGDAPETSAPVVDETPTAEAVDAVAEASAETEAASAEAVVEEA